MNYQGVIIEESLEDEDILKDVKILDTKVEEVVEKHKTPWIKKWSLHTVEIPENQAGSVAEKIGKALDSKHNWYADFKNDTHHYIIFRDKVFYIDRRSKAQYDLAKHYGISLGIPEYQLDFAPAKDTYFVAVKVFLEKNGKLLILKDNFGDWDLPGGRLEKDEFDVPLEQIIKRKMSAELGDDIQYTIGQPVVFMRHQRIEQVPGSPTVRIFAVGYQGILTSGTIHLSERHTEMMWIDLADFAPERYFKGGWLKGVREYLDIREKG